jgi:hypothetical protein
MPGQTKRHHGALDVHTIMNALNRIAAMEIRAGLDENQALMLLADYLQLGLMASERAVWSLREEWRLLDAFVLLDSHLSRRTVDWRRHGESAADVLVPRGLLAGAARALMHACSQASGGAWIIDEIVDHRADGRPGAVAVLTLHLQGQGAGHALDEADLRQSLEAMPEAVSVTFSQIGGGDAVDAELTLKFREPAVAE